jgi:hypothetical protein
MYMGWYACIYKFIILVDYILNAYVLSEQTVKHEFKYPNI